MADTALTLEEQEKALLAFNPELDVYTANIFHYLELADCGSDTLPTHIPFLLKLLQYAEIAGRAGAAVYIIRRIAEETVGNNLLLATQAKPEQKAKKPAIQYWTTIAPDGKTYDVRICPCCGGKVDIKQAETDEFPVYYIRCKDDACAVSAATDGYLIDLVTAWNKRITD